MAQIDVYDSGWLRAFRYAWRILTAPELAGHRAEALTYLRREWHYTYRAARERRWRAVRMRFNGWMAEPHDTTGIRRAGTGWTRARALKSLDRHNPGRTR